MFDAPPLVAQRETPLLACDGATPPLSLSAYLRYPRRRCLYGSRDMKGGRILQGVPQPSVHFRLRLWHEFQRWLDPFATRIRPLRRPCRVVK